MTANEPDRFGNLMRAAQDGNNAAYRQLLTEIAPVLRRIVGGHRTGLDVEDIVQEVLITVHNGRATYDPARPFLPWLVAIARSRTIDAMRRRGRVAANEVSGPELPETFSDPSAYSADETFGDADSLQEAIGQLPPGQRQAVEMLKLHEMSLKEASAASGVSVSALKTAAHRGMIALRKALKSKD